MYPSISLNLFRYAFFEYSSPANAHEAVKTTNGYKLDRTHTFSVNLVSDFDKYVSLSKVLEED